MKYHLARFHDSYSHSQYTDLTTYNYVRRNYRRNIP